VAVRAQSMEPLKNSAGPEVRILRHEASHGIAFAGRTLIAHWQTETRGQAVAELATLLSHLATEHGNLGLLQVISEQATPPDGATRAALAAMLKANENRIVASAVIYEGVGFRASMIRSIVVGISMLSRPKCPHTVFASTTAGIEWLAQHFQSSGGARYSAKDVQLATDQLRKLVRPA